MADAGGCWRCGRPLPPLRNSGRARKWCSEACRVQAYYRRHPKAVMSRVYFRECPVCGRLFTARAGATRLCSNACVDERIRVMRTRRADHKRYVQRRRARKRAAPSETIDALVLAERDHWTCGLCQQLIDPGLDYPDPKSLSVDHITPLALGGHHIYANTRAAHLDCNVKRGVRAA